MFSVRSPGSFSKTLSFLDRLKKLDSLNLNWAGKRGVIALSSATPKDTGETADSWDYRIVKLKNGRRIEWFNTHENNGVVIAVILQYGHGTGDGTWVEGKDYVNPAMAPVFDSIADDIWRQVKS